MTAPQSPPSLDGDASNREDISLMARVATKDEAAFRQLIEKHQHAVVGTIAKMLGSGNDAEDLAQQTFLRVWKSAKRYKPKAKFTTWLYTIVRNLVYNESRRRSRKATHSLDAITADSGHDIADLDAATPDDVVLKSELIQAVDRAIALLPKKQRLAVVLRQHQQLPYEEIATITGLSLAAVKSQLFRAREALKIELAKYLDA